MSQQINLYNPIFLKQKKIFSAATMAQALGLIALGLGAFGGYAYFQVDALEREVAAAAKRLSAEQARVGRLSQQFGARQKSAALEADLKKVDAELHALDQLMAALKQGGIGSSRGFSEYFKALGRQSIEGLWLTGFRVSPNEMQISGRTLRPESVPDFIGRLRDEKIMQGRAFAMLEMRRPEPTKSADGKSATLPAFVEFTLQSQPAEAAAK